ncbi:MAG: hypothetical protein Ta2B_06470 [Termitinemataceae bacterium]|nr:MAG: hypothetical protein Ta2B_06470 [Termitinemataceae bacterium]
MCPYIDFFDGNILQLRMTQGQIVDTLNFKAIPLSEKWKELIRKNPHLKHYNALSDEDLISIGVPVYKQLGRCMDSGIDRNIIGDFFVRMGKDRQEKGFPISESVYACNLSQEMIIDYMVSENINDNPLAIYQTLEIVNQINKFYFLGLFYMIKGYLEKTYTHMSTKHGVSENTLKECFNDDFFFKK